MDPEQAALMEAWAKASSPGAPHQGLAVMAGRWRTTTRLWMDPGAEPQSAEGVATREMLFDGRVLQERIQTVMMGDLFEGQAQTGFDNVAGRYWTTWMDNMSTGCYLAEGTRDEETGAITFRGEITDPVTGGTISTRTVLRPEGPDRQVVQHFEDRGRGENKVTEIVYEREQIRAQEE